MFEDIGKRESVSDLITNARKITNFIYNHGWLVATMRTICGGDIMRPKATKFTINYINLASLLKKRVDLKCDAPNPGVQLTTRQPMEFLWISGDSIPHCCVLFIGIHILKKKSGRASFVWGALPNI